MATPDAIERILFEIARTLDFCRNDPAFPESATHKEHATAHIEARRSGGRIEMDLIEWKGGPLDVVGGDWYEIPSLLLDLSRLLESTRGPVRRFAGRFSPRNVLTLHAKGAGGILGEWSFELSAEAAAQARRESPELVALADDVSGIPAGAVEALRDLNGFVRDRLFPLRPRAAIPVRFWRTADPVVLWSAAQHLYGHLLARHDYDASALPPLPDGYTTICTIFHAFDQIDCEGLETAIDNLGPDYRDALVARLRLIGLDALGDSFAQAWATHPAGASAEATAFDAIAQRLESQIDDEATLQAIHRHVADHAGSFESHG
jgi:hypothetical protein